MGETSGGHLSPPTLKNISQKHVFGLEYAISGRRVVDVWGSSLKNISRKHLSKTSLKNISQTHLSKKHLSKTSLKNISQKHHSKTSLKNISQKHPSVTSLKNISQQHLCTQRRPPPHIPSPIRGTPWDICSHMDIFTRGDTCARRHMSPSDSLPISIPKGKRFFRIHSKTDYFLVVPRIGKWI
jgi:hypothetical protein